MFIWGRNGFDRIFFLFNCKWRATPNVAIQFKLTDKTFNNNALAFA